MLAHEAVPGIADWFAIVGSSVEASRGSTLMLFGKLSLLGSTRFASRWAGRTALSNTLRECNLDRDHDQ